MNWMWIPYWLNVIANLGTTVFCFVLVLGIALLVAGFVCAGTAEYSQYAEPSRAHLAAKKICLVLLWIEIPLAFLSCFIPSKEVMYQMAGFGAAQTVIQSPTANKAVQLANEYLDKQLSLIKGEKEPKK